MKSIGSIIQISIVFCTAVGFIEAKPALIMTNSERAIRHRVLQELIKKNEKCGVDAQKLKIQAHTGATLKIRERKDPMIAKYIAASRYFSRFKTDLKGRGVMLSVAADPDSNTECHLSPESVKHSPGSVNTLTLLAKIHNDLVRQKKFEYRPQLIEILVTPVRHDELVKKNMDGFQFSKRYVMGRDEFGDMALKEIEVASIYINPADENFPTSEQMKVLLKPVQQELTESLSDTPKLVRQ